MSEKPTLDQLRLYASEFNNSQSLKFFGAVISFPTQQRVVITMAEIRPEFRGGMGTSAVNGGVLAAMFDLVIGCTPALVDPTRRSATMQLSMNFMKPVNGDSLHVEGRIDSHGKATLYASAQLLDAKGVVCATCQGLVKVARIPWEAGSSPAVN
jgi:uncharacterized protein (TIGR00369 family)